jgi:hypothetical protein
MAPVVMTGLLDAMLSLPPEFALTWGLPTAVADDIRTGEAYQSLLRSASRKSFETCATVGIAARELSPLWREVWDADTVDRLPMSGTTRHGSGTTPASSTADG